MKKPSLKLEGLLPALLVLGACKQDYSLSLSPTQSPESTSPSGGTNPGTDPNAGGGPGPMGGLVAFSQEINVAAQTVPKQIIFVMDTSGSMDQEIDTVKASLADFSEAFTQTGKNYKIAVTTTDPEGIPNDRYFDLQDYADFFNAGPGSFMSSKLNLQPQTRWVDSSILTPQAAHSQLVRNFSVPTSGSGYESGLLAIKAAVSNALVGTAGWNAGFFIPNSQIEFIILSDEDDSLGEQSAFAASGLNHQKYYSRRNPAFAEARVNEVRDAIYALNNVAFRSQIRANVIGGIPNSPDLTGCPLNYDNNDPATGLLGTANSYIDLAQKTGGQVISICKIVDGVRGDFSQDLAFLGQSIAASFPSVFNLERVPADPNTIRVFLNDIELERGNRTQGFVFNAANNTIELGSFVESLTMGFTLRIQFDVAAP